MISHHTLTEQKTVVIRKIGIRTCFQFFLLITRLLKGALFYHGRQTPRKQKRQQIVAKSCNCVCSLLPVFCVLCGQTRRSDRMEHKDGRKDRSKATQRTV
jgi:hypothetical protein